MIKSYEVTVANTQYKTLLVNAESAEKAEEIAQEAYLAGEYGFDDAEPEFCAVDTRPATGELYEITYPGEDEYEDDIDEPDYSLIDILFDGYDDYSCDSCKRCCNRDICDVYNSD